METVPDAADAMHEPRFDWVTSDPQRGARHQIVLAGDLHAVFEEVRDVDDAAALEVRIRNEGRHVHLNVPPSSPAQRPDIEDVDALVDDLAEDDGLAAVVGAVGALQHDGRLNVCDAPWTPVGHLGVDVDDVAWDGGGAADVALEFDLRGKVKVTR